MLHKKTIKHINKLQQKKYRKDNGEFLVEGVKGVFEALSSEAEVLAVFMEGSKRDEKEMAEIVSLCENNHVPIEFIGRKEIGEIKTTDTFPGVLAVLGIKEVSPEMVLESGPIICLDHVNDPGNLGTIIRTADWFGIKNIILSEGSVDPYNPKVVRSTMGSMFRVNIFEAKNAEKLLKKAKEKYTLVGLDLEGKPMDKLKAKPNTIYVFGSESHGLSTELEKLLDESYSIPGKGDAESLNLAISAGILMSRI